MHLCPRNPFVALPIALAVLLGQSESRSAETPTVIDLDGLRHVRVSLTETGDEYALTIRFDPVRTFDHATNLRINRQKASSYAWLAFAQYLDLAPNQRLVVSGANFVEPAQVGDEFSATTTIPKEAVRVVSAKTSGTLPAMETGSSPSASARQQLSPATHRKSPLLTRKEDYIDTLRSLEDVTEEELSNGVDEENMSAVEERFLGAASALEAEVQRDKLLLSVERQELAAAIDAAKNTFRTNLEARVQSLSQPTGAE